VKVGDLVQNVHHRHYSSPRYGLVLAVSDGGALIWWDRYRDSYRPDIWNKQSCLEVVSESR